jgi:tetratricopeptide (TPR) repeat protein
MTLNPIDFGEMNLALPMLVMPKSEEPLQTPSKAPFELDPALQHAPELPANSSLVFRSLTGNHEARLRQFEFSLGLARTQRKALEFAQSSKTLESILESDAPSVIKQTAFLELAFVAQQDRQYVKALKIFSKYIQKYSQDPSVPEITLRQGLLFRELGLYDLAVSKFYSVMTASLNIKHDQWDYYKRLVLQAQTEVAETFYLQGNYEEAARKFSDLLALDAPALRKDQIQSKMILCLSSLDRSADVVAKAQDFLKRFPNSEEMPEVRFHLVNAYRQLKREQEALEQVVLLLKSQEGSARQNPENWRKWQLRTGNQIGNQLYKEGNYADALIVYQALAQIDNSPEWQFPVLYQVGLVLERFNLPQKAAEVYHAILARENELATNNTPSARTMLEMAKWRRDFLGWQGEAQKSAQKITKTSSPNSPVSSSN